MEKDFNYYDINEVMGVPDPDRTEQLIDAVLERIDQELHKYLYSCGIKNNFVVEESIVSGIFMLSGDLNICPWLDENTEFIYRYDLRSNRFVKGARFVPILGETDVFVDSDGFRKIRYAKFILDFSFGTDCVNDPEEIGKRRDEIKVVLRHEFQHAYNELMKHENVPLRDDSEMVEYGIVDQTRFMQGYNVVSGRLYKKEYETETEKNLLYAMYLLNYLEMNANVAGFYQRLVNDYDLTGYIGDISIYKEYENYRNAIDFIDGFEDQDLFDMYKEVIQYMYGSFVKGINKFRNCLKSKADKFFKKVDKLHRNLKKDIEENSEVCDGRVHDLKNSYLIKNVSRLHSDYSDLDESEQTVVEMVAGHYLYTETDYYLGLVDKWFEPLRK